MSETYFDEQGTELDDTDLHEYYDDMLNETYGEIDLGCSYSASETLKAVDPIAYRCGFSDWLDSELGERIFEEDPTAVELAFSIGDEVKIVPLDRIGVVIDIDKGDRELPYEIQVKGEDILDWYEESELTGVGQTDF
jgi:hypothetical protein